MYQRLRLIFKKDISHLYVATASQLSGLEPNNAYHAKILEPIEVKKLSKNPVNEISTNTAESVNNVSVFCCAVFLDNALLGYSFFGKGVIPAESNSGGAGFGGIGLDMPKDVIFMYKVFVLPKFRGKNLIALAARAASCSLLPSGGWVVTTTDTSNYAAQGLFRKLGFVKRERLSEYRVFGIGFYRMVNNLEIVAEEPKQAITIGLFSGARFI